MNRLRTTGNRLYRKGISLVEILVAVAITAILVAIVYTYIGGAREDALRLQCVANLRGYGSAVLSKLAAEGRLPYWDGLGSADTESGKPNWESWLVPTYLDEIPRCPLVGVEELASGSGFHYAANSGLLIYYAANPLSMPVPSSRVVLASEMAGKNDGVYSPTHLNMTMWGLRDADAGSNLNTGREGTARRSQYHGRPHERGLNLFFLDGSIKLVSPRDLNWWSEADRDYYFFWRDHFRRISLGRINE